MKARSLPKRMAWAAWRVLPEILKRPVWVLRHGAPPDRQWLRAVMNRDVAHLLEQMRPQQIDAVEVSGTLRADLPWRSYTRLEYPDFDLTSTKVEAPRFDLVICEQVLEHVADPITAVRTLASLCRPGGHVLVSTPFLLRIHGHPEDYWRFTPLGLKTLLKAGQLEPLWVRSWGNAAVVKRNLGHWTVRPPWRSVRNNPSMPIVVWALAQRPATIDD
jgi:SAM-dependent methyltransferase